MLRGSEKASVWRALKLELDRRGWAYDRIENKVNLGMPDVNVHVPEVGDFWIELKFCRTPDNQISLGLRKEQRNWLIEAHQAGRRVVLLARVGKEWWAWSNEVAWRKAALSSQDWSELKQLGRRLNGAVEVCNWMMDY